ncbi:MAG TPA: GDP-mannose 4,6-dehydratase [Candidatus Angelobacter sp.]|nr:GDP-mannose 4,6-dehydratase [Candidatus Angelobacter sp.]
MRALITGITGQDGSYLAELLLGKGYEVHGVVRSLMDKSRDSLTDIAKRISFIAADLSDQTSLDRAVQQSQPDEVYNLAGQTFVPVAWNQPLMTMEATGMGALRMLEAIRRHAPSAKFLQVSSSEIFGKTENGPQTEMTRLQPGNPYGAAKLFAHHMTINYRESYGMFACCCIAFNHESPRRSVEFVTRKVSQQVARIKMGLASKLKMGNIEARRDWGFAGDYVRAMWMMMQQPQPVDLVIATGVTHSVKQLLEIAFAHVGLDWKKHVEIDPALMRPTEEGVQCGDASKAKKLLGWKPEMSFKKLVEMMVDFDLALLSQTTKFTATAVAGD